MAEEKTNKQIVLVDVATASEKRVLLPGSEEPLDIPEYLVWLGNQVMDLKKNIG